MAQPQSTPQPQKAFPVSWDQFHRDARALAWRLAEAGPFTTIVAITLSESWISRNRRDRGIASPPCMSRWTGFLRSASRVGVNRSPPVGQNR